MAPGQHGPTRLSEVATAQIDVVVKRDFEPLYKWQQVYPWQSVPPGLEVQLLDNGGQKLARLPPSYDEDSYPRIQLNDDGEAKKSDETVT